jgi:hypothetical protein
MALSFPTSPAAGDQYIAPNGVTYTWNATLGIWASSGISGAGGGGGGGGVTSVTASAPIASSGGAAPVISLTPGTARQLLETNSSGTGVQFASNIDVPGTLDVTGVGTFDGNLRFNSGYGSAATAYGCRAWVNFDGVPASPTIRGSGNVSSVTKNGTGDYTVNFTTAMPDANYATFVTAQEDTVGVVSSGSRPTLYRGAPYTTSAVRVVNSLTDGTFGAFDVFQYFVSIVR